MGMLTRHVRIAIAALIPMAAQVSSARAAAMFQGLGTLPGTYFWSEAYGVSGDGSVVVGMSVTNTSTPTVKAWRWTSSEGMVPIGDLSGGLYRGAAHDVSYDGSVIVGVSESASGLEAFRWTQDTGMQGLGDLPGGSYHSFGAAVSADGSVVAGTSSSTPGSQAFRWTSETGMVGLGDLPGDDYHSEAHGISGDGSVIVGQGNNPTSSANDGEAFRWTAEEGMVGLGYLADSPHGWSDASAISTDGSTIVGETATDAGREAFRWTAEEEMVAIGDVPGEGVASGAFDVSGDGSVIVGWCTEDPYLEAFIWDAANGIRKLSNVLTDDYGLDLSGWRLYRAYGISDDGLTIVGYGSNPSGAREAYVAYLPEPGSVVVLAIGCVAAMGRRKHKRSRQAGQVNDA